MTRTTVEPVTAAHLEALIAGDAVFEERFGIRVAPDYLAFPESLAYVVPDPAWSAHLIIDPDSNELVGFGGYKGPPRDNTVEIGYSLSPEHQHKGHATRASQEWIRRARAAGVTTVLAHTLPEPSASTRVLERCGFVMVGETTDPDHPEEEIVVWRWERA